MVEDAITDGRRIGELLASELTGLTTGPLADIAVVDADPRATPSPAGTRAYRLRFRDKRIGQVELSPAHVTIRLDAGTLTDPVVPDWAGISVRTAGSEQLITVESGAAVKAVVDVFRTGLGTESNV